MAIIPELPGVEATIRVHNSPLREYTDNEDEGPSPESNHARPASHTVSKYVESSAGQEFSVHFCLKSPYLMDCPALEFSLSVDGHKIRGKILEKEAYNPAASWWAHRSGIDEGRPGKMGILRPFTFAGIKTSLDEDALSTVKDDMDRVNKIGEIIVGVYRHSSVIWVPKAIGHDTLGDMETSVHEKALKGQPKYHSVKLGDAKPKQVSTHSARSKRLDAGPIARFVFKYRSRDALQQLLIIPRTPEPEPYRSHASVAMPMLGVKRECGESSQSAGKAFKKRKSESIACVDLTGDSDDDDFKFLN